jgi:hypothetical protein
VPQKSWLHDPPQSRTQGQTSQELPDVPADSTSLIERMMINLRKATASSSPVG